MEFIQSKNEKEIVFIVLYRSIINIHYTIYIFIYYGITYSISILEHMCIIGCIALQSETKSSQCAAAPPLLSLKTPHLFE